ncbi:PIN/TRAM domain-containing protein [Calorimonas adulescens]|uniref:PIN/TRAM domain-containing protein n=1 Tax=Calorimonas adulescens TaxID=2606906 RepID=A0A5D8QDE6_9THEO|nr:PIN/TRAM domain-containing protein [Calorimonas adulescens]
MLRRIVRIALFLVGLGLGYEIALGLLWIFNFQDFFTFSLSNNQQLFFIGLIMLGCGTALYLSSPRIIKWSIDIAEWMDSSLQKVPTNEILVGIMGLIVGLIIANLVSTPFRLVPVIGIVVTVILNIVLGYVGVVVAVHKKDELSNMFSFLKKMNKEKLKPEDRIQPKVLDTSVIIDGRILDICKTGFIEGNIIIPGFVLEELRHIADSSDTLKRNRGRRGLDILNKMQKELNVKVEINERDFPEIAEVDLKILKLAQVIGGKVVTNDYNLNKVAEFQGVSVLNINELSNAVKPVVLPGEEMVVQVIKDGKESGQGIAYLDDGTMIVVDGGKKYIGDTLEVVVTSVLQTAAGRMIFAKPRINIQEKAI